LSTTTCLKSFILGDDTYLYIAGFVQEPQIWANQTKHNSVVFDDNDFEVFVDPDGSTHNYKEFEINARNTTWSLMLNKPYIDGGHPTNDNFAIKSAVFVDGRLNDPSIVDHYWTVELGFPFKQYITNDSIATAPPRNKDIWRINFSRVEWHVKVVDKHFEKVPNLPADNWVWTSQESINMHLPGKNFGSAKECMMLTTLCVAERWGFLQFSNEPVNSTRFENKNYNVRLCLAQTFYALHQFESVNGYYTAELQTLPSNCLDGSLQTTPPIIDVPILEPYSFQITIKSLNDGAVGHMRTGLFWCCLKFDNIVSIYNKL
jgi:hypothetical protein